MRLKIENSTGVILELIDEQTAILPTIEQERVLAFSALTHALALLSGVMPQSSFCATEGETDEHSPSIEQCHSARRNGNVVLLKGRQAFPIAP
jgi:hypothetical protein